MPSSNNLPNNSELECEQNHEYSLNKLPFATLQEPQTICRHSSVCFVSRVCWETREIARRALLGIVTGEGCEREHVLRFALVWHRRTKLYGFRDTTVARYPKR